ncbi:MAG: hypothetical protein FWC60_11495, partial [Firmicutes bacterium]|nr:hypothetical protein [Bacillota bacterium]
MKRFFNKRRFFRKSIAAVMSLIMLLSFVQGGILSALAAPSPPGGGEESNFVSDDNGYIKYYVNTTDGSFYIMPSTQSFDQSKAASFGMFRIGGQTYKFGDAAAGALGFVQPFKNDSGTTQTTWYFQNYAITEYLNIIQDSGSPNSYAVYVGYDIRNDSDGSAAGTATGVPADVYGVQDIQNFSYGATGADLGISGGEIGARIVLDTQFGPHDDQPVAANGLSEYITNERTISPAPDDYMMDENAAGEAPYAYGLIRDSRFTSPSALTFAHFQSLLNGGFDYQPNSSINFTAPNNSYGVSDSGVALDFSVNGNDAQVQTIGTVYGFRDLTQNVAPAIPLLPLMAPLAPLGGPLPIGSGAVNDGVNFNALAGSGIYFGSYAQGQGVNYPQDYENNPVTSYGAPSPVFWDTMGEETINGAGDGMITFMSDKIPDYSKYYPDNSEPVYSSSLVESFLNTSTFTGGFNGAELGAIKPVTVSTQRANVYQDTATSQKFYIPWCDWNGPQLTPGGVQNGFGALTNPQTVHWSASDTADGTDLNGNPCQVSNIIPTSLVTAKVGATDNGVYWTRGYVALPNPFYPPTGYSNIPCVGLINGTPGIFTVENTDSVFFGAIGTEGNPMYSYEGLRPIFKLDPASVVNAATFQNGYRLTIAGANVGTLANVPSSARTVYTEPANNSNSFTLSGLTATPANAGDFTNDSAAYKVVGTDALGNRTILDSGSRNFNASEISGSAATFDLPIDIDGCAVGGTYDVYVWLQRNNSMTSDEASAPQHFQINVARAQYTVTTSLGAGCSLNVNPAGPYLSGAAVTLSNIAYPADMKDLINVYYDKAGAKANMDLIDNSDGTYSFTMPAGNVEVHMDAYDKTAAFIQVESNQNGNVILDKYAGMPGDTITATAQQTDLNYYVSGLELYQTWTQAVTDSSGNTTGTNTVVDTAPFATVSFANSNTQSFTIPSDIGSNSVLARLVIQDAPGTAVTIPVSLTYQGSTIPIVPDNGVGWEQSGGMWTKSDYLPGQKVQISITAGAAYLGFDVDSVTLGGSSYVYTSSGSDFAGVCTRKVSLTMPALTTIGAWANGDLSIALTPRKIYQQYTVTSVTPDAGVFANLTSFKVTGTGLEQIAGQGADYQALTPAQQQKTKTVTFGTHVDGGMNPQLADGSVTLNADGSLTIAVSADLISQLTPNANGTFYLSI